MRILGLDASTTCTGWCLFEDNKVIDYGNIRPPKEYGLWRDKIAYLTQEIFKLLDKLNADEVCVEVPLCSVANIKTVRTLFSLHGAIMGVCSLVGVPIIPIEVSEWRQSLGLLKDLPKGRTKNILKQRSIDLANKLYGLDLVYKSPSSQSNQDDIADSILLTHCYIHKNQRGFGVTKEV